MRKLVFVFVWLISYTLSARELGENTKTSSGLQIDRICNTDVNFQLPRFIFNYTNTRIVVKFTNPNHAKLKDNNYELNFIVNGTDQKVVFDENGVGNFYYTFRGNNALQIFIEDLSYTTQPAVISIWYIILPLTGLLLFFVYKIFTSVRNNKGSNLTVNHNIIDANNEDVQTFTSTLKVVSVKEREEHF